MACLNNQPTKENIRKTEAVLDAVNALLAEVAREKSNGKLGLPG